jgi:hypothetical protein
MRTKKVLFGLALSAMAAPAFGQSQTAQSAMVDVQFDNSAYQIEGTITWTFERGTAAEPGPAMAAFTNTRTGGPEYVTCGGSAAQCGVLNTPSAASIAAAEPAPSALELQQEAQAARCTFFFGGTLSSPTYTQEATVKGANGSGNWKYKWTYTISPVTATVGPYTAWTSVETGGTVDVGFSGFVASESYLKQSNKNKYSFTMVEGGVTRARDVAGALQRLSGPDWDTVATADLNNVATTVDGPLDGLATAPATDFLYNGNGGVFGNSAVFSALHAPARKAANTVGNILIGADAAPADNFAGNDNDIAGGNVHAGPFAATFGGLTEDGTYRVVVSGALKGNASSASFGFSVASSLVTIGGCTPQ